MDKYLRWIEKNKIKYDIGLVSLGLLLGIGVNLLYGGETRQGLTMAFAFASIFLATDLSIWGSK